MNNTTNLIPMPQCERLVRVCRSILREPGRSFSLNECSKAAAMGRRTFTRRFRRETKVSFAEWQRQARFVEALSRLSAGHSVTDVAFDVGYGTVSAFSAMFRRTAGSPPSRFQRSTSSIA